MNKYFLTDRDLCYGKNIALHLERKESWGQKVLLFITDWEKVTKVLFMTVQEKVLGKCFSSYQMEGGEKKQVKK